MSVISTKSHMQDFHYIIVADIFGRTKALEEIATLLPHSSDIFDPYVSKGMGFASETEAYSFFVENVGLEKYTNDLLIFLSSIDKPIVLLGFSVGASAIWKISDQSSLLNIHRAICFYGSQIRNNITIDPIFPVQLIFPSFEIGFSVEELMKNLAGRVNVELQRVEYLHGFMNTHSKNYDHLGYEKFIEILSIQESA